jgi:hypothetical protein
LRYLPAQSGREPPHLRCSATTPSPLPVSGVTGGGVGCDARAVLGVTLFSNPGLQAARRVRNVAAIPGETCPRRFCRQHTATDTTNTTQRPPKTPSPESVRTRRTSTHQHGLARCGVWRGSLRPAVHAQRLASLGGGGEARGQLRGSPLRDASTGALSTHRAALRAPLSVAPPLPLAATERGRWISARAPLLPQGASGGDVSTLRGGAGPRGCGVARGRRVRGRGGVCLAEERRWVSTRREWPAAKKPAKKPPGDANLASCASLLINASSEAGSICFGHHRLRVGCLPSGLGEPPRPGRPLCTPHWHAQPPRRSAFVPAVQRALSPLQSRCPQTDTKEDGGGSSRGWWREPLPLHHRLPPRCLRCMHQPPRPPTRSPATTHRPARRQQGRGCWAT